MYLLDTNHCSRIIQGDTVLVRRLQELGKVPVATNVIVCGELTFMAQNSQQRAANIIRVQVFLRGIDIYPIDRETADIYGQFKAEIITQFGPRERSRRRTTKIEELGMSENDLWIASTALRHEITLVSADSDFQRMREVRAFSLESWLSPDTPTPPTP
ncbi:MAG: type II toxin-antitoxin system VapC family toxin [Symplocastrum torsivum CPER-KK1]|uniref:Type II toxin-antitoxin system VapC family toxin n=1 Tax=Symplocastrum torsivum CPER-KK1 TaxID=450513 RepID=A0A951PIU2_9CYAN|nr:type II toxin-antitoxin system VapC family toxin [Symplocastrum torsivum CPER-KK1]